MVPSLLCGELGLKPRILDRHRLDAPDTLLLHGDTIQVSLVAGAGARGLAQLLAGVVHAAVHAVALALDLLVLLAAEELPGAVDGPVAEVAEAGHAEGRRGRGEHVLLEDADAVEVLRLVLLVAAARGGLGRRGLFDGRGGLAREEGGRRGEEAGGHGGHGGDGPGEEPAEGRYRSHWGSYERVRKLLDPVVENPGQMVV